MTTNGNGKGNRSNNRGHRKKIEIDFRELEKLCYLQCTEREIADWFHCGISTIEVRIKEQFGISFREYFETKRVGGLISLRRNMFKLSEKHPHMAIFLAKNWLGMADKTELANPIGESFRVEHNARGKLVSLLNSLSARVGEAESNTEAKQ